jgi:hypothetical protein
MFSALRFIPTGEDHYEHTLSAAKAVLLLAEMVGVLDQEVRLHDTAVAEVLWGIVDVAYAAVAAEAVEQHNAASDPDAQYEGSIPVLQEFYSNELGDYEAWADMVLAPLVDVHSRTHPHPDAATAKASRVTD